jgi:hypothetical protein
MPTSQQKNYLYEYAYDWYGDGRLVAQGERTFVEQFISIAEFSKLFGGFIACRSLDGKEEYLGVWKVRTVQRFKRLLRERGAIFEVKKERPPISEPGCSELSSNKKGNRNHFPAP